MSIVISFSLQGCIPIPSGDDADEARTIRDALVERYPFPRHPAKDSNEDGAEVYWTPYPSRSNIFVYGVRERTDQDAICHILEAIRREQHRKPIKVEFHSSPTQNGPNDTILREVTLK